MSRPQLRLPPPVKVSYPIGACMDIPTGEYVKGMHGQMVLNGGIAFVTGYLGPGNSFKTTVMRYAEISLMDRMIVTSKGDDLYASSYDTEVNVRETRAKKLTQQPHFRFLAGRDILDEGIWQMTDKTIYSGNEYFDEKKKFLKAKRDAKGSAKYASAFMNREGTGPMMTMAVTLDDYDSLSRFDTDNEERQLDKSEIGSSEQNTVHMNAGKAKSSMLGQMPVLAASCHNYTSFVAHIGKEIDMGGGGPGRRPPRKSLQGLEDGVVIKGVTNHFYYLILNCWYILVARPYLNQGTKAPEYPHTQGDERPGDMDLHKLQMKQLRGKGGGSMFVIELIVSEKEGVLPYLTEFHNIKEHNRFGIQGNNVNFQLVLAPDVNLMRTTVRQKLRESPRLQRAVNITSELCQLYEYHPELKSILMPPEELYKALKDRGYDWEFILTQTRGWHTLDDELHPLFPFSTLDLCRAARGLYHPYYLEADCKTIKKEYDEKRYKFEYKEPLNLVDIPDEPVVTIED